jgi:hypothetical protein
MSIRQITKVWDSSPFEGTKLLIHLALADISHDDGRFFASQKLLANKSRCSIEYIRKVINEMVDEGYIKIVTKGSSVGKATVYQLLEKTQLPNPVEEIDNQLPNSDTPNSPTLTVQLPNSTPYHPSYTPVLSTTKDIPPEAEIKVVSVDPSFSARDVVAEYVDEWRRVHSQEPVTRQIGQIARAARELLESERDPEIMLESARRCARDGHANLSASFTWLIGAGTRTRYEAPKVSKATMKTQALLELADRLGREEAQITNHAPHELGDIQLWN